MKRIFLAIAVCGVLASCATRNQEASAATTNVVANDPAKNVTTPTAPAMDPTTVQLIDSVHDFGNVVDGAVVEYSYRFKNTGDKPLVISNATASCGCTVPEKPEQPILPGETGYIKVKFDSKGRVGEALKTINVESNAAPTFPQLLLKGQVKAAAGS